MNVLGWLMWPVLYVKAIISKRKLKRTINTWYDSGRTTEQLVELMQNEGWQLSMDGEKYVFTKDDAVLRIWSEWT